MKMWWAANAYWVFLLGVIIYLIETHPFDTSELGEPLSHALMYVLVVAVFVLIAEFQIAWLMFIKGKQQDHH